MTLPAFEPAAERKKPLGAFYTPPAMASKLVSWAITEPGDRALDPSFGGLAFLEAAHARLVELGSGPAEAGAQLYGIDLDEDAFASATAHERLRLPEQNLRHEDFFNAVPSSSFPLAHAVVGNPPYVRYQGWDRTTALRLVSGRGVPLTRLASSWAPFLIHSVDFVAEGGRLAFVLPAEMLHAQYAADILEFLQRSFAELHIAVFDNRVFPGALEEVVLLFAGGRGHGPSSGIHLVECRDLDDLNIGDVTEPPRPPVAVGRGKLLFQLLGDATQELYTSLADREAVTTMDEIASVDIGIVTGGNDFFLLPPEEADQLPDRLLQPTVSKARHVRGARIAAADIDRLCAGGAALDLFVADASTDPELIQHAMPLIRRGKRLKIHKRYKCRIREPWWAVPTPAGGAADLLMTYCSNEFPRVAANDARVLNTNTVHGITMRTGAVAADDLAAGFYNSLTLLSAEIVGRSYGGGVLKLEPTEAGALLLPPIAGAGRLLDQVDEHLRGGDLQAALDLVDGLVLRDRLALTDDEIAALRAGAQKLRARRLARGRSPAKPR